MIDTKYAYKEVYNIFQSNCIMRLNIDIDGNGVISIGYIDSEAEKILDNCLEEYNNSIVKVEIE